MGVTSISKNLKKTSIEIDKWGNIVSQNTANTRQEELKQKQDQRARRLGFRR